MFKKKFRGKINIILILFSDLITVGPLHSEKFEWYWLYLYVVQFAWKHFLGGANRSSITRPNCALDRRSNLCLYVPGFQRQVFTHVENLSERSKEMKERKKNKGSVLVSESAHSLQNAHNICQLFWFLCLFSKEAASACLQWSFNKKKPFVNPPFQLFKNRFDAEKEAVLPYYLAKSYLNLK